MAQGGYDNYGNNGYYDQNNYDQGGNYQNGYGQNGYNQYGNQNGYGQNGYGYNNDNYYNNAYQNGANYQMFYNDLAPYGNWIQDPQYGYVWAPNCGADFRPYSTNGYWAQTSYGNTWMSNYAWGWAPFHYGRWTYNNWYRSWVWIPGNTWGPAWVSWRQGGGNYGWAPMGPGVNINISFGGGGWNAPSTWWNFVPQNYLYNNSWRNHCYQPQQNNTIINNTTVINNTYNNTYVTGPRPRDYERATGQRVNVMQVSDVRTPRSTSVRGNVASIYRPTIHETPRSQQSNIRPAQVVRQGQSLDAVRSNNNMNQNGGVRGSAMNGGRNADTRQDVNGTDRFSGTRGNNNANGINNGTRIPQDSRSQQPRIGQSATPRTQPVSPAPRVQQSLPAQPQQPVIRGNNAYNSQPRQDATPRQATPMPQRNVQPMQQQPRNMGGMPARQQANASYQQPTRVVPQATPPQRATPSYQQPTRVAAQPQPSRAQAQPMAPRTAPAPRMAPATDNRRADMGSPRSNQTPASNGGNATRPGADRMRR